MMEKGYSEVNGTELYYERSGEGYPIIFIHGFSLDNRMWDPQFSEFSRKFDVIRYDLRGFGRSGALKEDLHYRHADDLREFMSSMGINCASLVGLSKGGAVAINFSIAYPEMVSKLVLADAEVPGFGVSNSYRKELDHIWSMAAVGGINASKDAWLKHAFFAPAQLKPDVIGPIREMVSGYSGWHFMHKDPELFTPVPAINHLHDIRMPLLVLVGKMDIPDFIDESILLSKSVKGSRLEFINGVGHMSNMEDPETFNRLSIQFLSE